MAHSSIDDETYVSEEKTRLADTNITPDMIDTFTPSVLRNQKMILHSIYIGDTFKCSALLDAPILDQLPEPYTHYRPSPENIYKIAPTENKGLGMFATRNIPTGGLILAERPIVVWPLMLLSPAGYSIFDMLVERLEPADRREFFSLANCKSEDECGAAEGILRTNNIGIHFPVPEGMHKYAGNYRGLFLNISRCNHSCGPNATWHWDGQSTFSLSLFATHPIQAGEEITVAYCDLLESREKRQAKLRKMYNIDCKCEYCDLPNAKALAESDQRRKEIQEFYIALDPCVKTMSVDNLIKAHLHALVSISKEGLWTFELKHLETLALLYYQLRDQRNWRRWAEKVIDAYRAEDSQVDVSRWQLALLGGPLIVRET